MSSNSNPKIIVAMDFAHAVQAKSLAQQLDSKQCALKVGMQLFTSAGPAIVEHLVNLGFNVFLDLKYHDIPSTVAKACLAAADLGVWMINVHTLGGMRMLNAAREAIDSINGIKPLLIGVTLLTSHTADEVIEIGLTGELSQQSLRLANMAQQAGLDGVVCSSQEATLLRQEFASEFCLVTPGIRLTTSVNQDDQRRIMTPSQAITAGSSYLVIGRPITQADDPSAVLQSINAEIN